MRTSMSLISHSCNIKSIVFQFLVFFLLCRKYVDGLTRVQVALSKSHLSRKSKLALARELSSKNIHVEIVVHPKLSARLLGLRRLKHQLVLRRSRLVLHKDNHHHRPALCPRLRQ